MERGQVYYVRYDDSVGDEMAIGRPVLIVSNNGDISELDTVIVAYMTTGLRKSRNVVKLKMGGKIQYVHCSQLRTISKSRLLDYLGQLSDEDMMKVDNALALAMSYNRPPEKRMAEEEVTTDVADNSWMEMELTVYKGLYEKAVRELIELKFQKDTNVVVKEIPVEVEVEKIVEVEKVVEKPRELTEDEILEYIDRMFGEDTPVVEVPPVVEETPTVEVTKKAGRPPKHGMGNHPTREQVNQYKKDGKANLNTDEWWVIAATTGMSMNNARRIVAYRENVGKFKRVKDLINVNFVKPAFIEKYGSMLEV